MNIETSRRFVDSSIFQVEEGVPGHGEQGHPGGDSVPDLRGPQLPGGGGDLLHAAQPGAGGRGGQEVRGGRHLDQPPQPQVSCDWWTAGHVTTILISDCFDKETLLSKSFSKIVMLNV